jgi:biotin transport system substrate-specific component
VGRGGRFLETATLTTDRAGVRPILVALVPEGALWRVALVVLGTALLALAARIEIPLPFSPVPVTGQTFAVLVLAAALGARLGAVTVVAYILEGIVGLPVFAGGASGLARLTGPTGGYLMGFVVAAAIIGWAAERGWTTRIPTTVATMLAGEVAIYAFGLAWLSRFPLPVGVLDAGLYPFIAGDVYKIALAVAILPLIMRKIR